MAGSKDDVTVTVTASEPEDGGITVTDSDGLIGAGFVDEEETDLEGSLTVKATDQGSRAFEIEGECITPGAMVTIVVEDKDLDEVAKGYILCKEPVIIVPEDDDVPFRHHDRGQLQRLGPLGNVRNGVRRLPDRRHQQQR